MITDEPKLAEEPRPFRFHRGQYYRMDELGLFRGRKVELIDGTIYEHPADEEPRPVRWTHGEYYQMAESGLFEGCRVELIEGTVIEMPPMKSPHFASLGLTVERLREVFGAGYVISVQAPLDLGAISNPEPDLAVLMGSFRDYRDALPTSAVLVVEIGDTSLRYDQTEKVDLYARAGIAEYWIVNLNSRQLEIRRQPQALPGEPLGYGYASLLVLEEPETASPLACPEAKILVAALLP